MGTIVSRYWAALSQGYPPKALWSVNGIPDLAGKVAVVTGGNSGIGYETCKQLLVHNAKVFMAARDEGRARKAIDELKNETGKEAIFLRLDLADLKAVKASAEEFLAKEDALNILINNAGVMRCPIDWLTVDGYDMQFGCNVLGHHFFTQLLLPALLAGTDRTREKSRIVTVSSAAHYFGPGIDFDTFKDCKKRRWTPSELLYCQSKLGNAIVSREFARRYGDKLVSICVNPGNIMTSLYKHFNSLHMFAIGIVFNPQPLPMGAITQLYAATAPECADKNGKFLVPWAREALPNSKALDPKLGARLWDWLEGECTKYH
ncbi:NAD(P)-binding protein [Peniophora sp. CONT]|nr:NAD(P)-binding protein [Peniophora sp. CONT]